MPTRQEPSFCRICVGVCGVNLTIDDSDRIVSVRGEKNNPLTQGFACIKGLEAPAAHNHPDRLLHPLKRKGDGSFERIPLEQALDEIAEKLSRIIDDSGARSVATFRGTPNYNDSTCFHMLPAWSAAIESPSFFSTMTIDQSAKWVSVERLGSWQAGSQSFLDSDVWMFVGTNPVVSLMGGWGFPPFNPVKRMKEARERGMTLIVIDPRLTDTAKFADIHLQLRAGEDVALAAGLLHIILNEGWHDITFCENHVSGLDDLVRAVAPFTPDYVANRTGVSADLLRQAAEAFAHNGKRGACTTGTGPNLAIHSNLSQHLYECLNVVCGRFPSAGDPVSNPGACSPREPLKAQVVAPQRSWERGHKSRIGNSGVLFGEMMSGILCDEIITPGEGQIKSLIVASANPALVFPDQRKTVDALKQLELLVTIDPVMSATAKLSHYILPPKLQYERADLAIPHYDKYIIPIPYAQYTPAIVQPPEGSDVAEDWYFFWALASRLGRPINYCGSELDMKVPPTTDDLLALVTQGSEIPFETLREQREGAAISLPPQQVEPADPDCDARFQVAPDDVIAEMASVVIENFKGGRDSQFSHRLISRRIRELQNSSGRDIPEIRQRVPFNPAYIHPDDLAAYDLAEGDIIEISSFTGSIETPVKADDTVLPGTISMTHGFGGLPDEPDDYGVATSLLVTTDYDIETINAMPRMSAIPVNIKRV